MRIAAKLAGAVLSGLLMLPAAVKAETSPPEPQVLEQQEFAAPDQASIPGAPELIRTEESAQLILKKRKKPMFQTRFFAE